jgi:predicted transcriptional regulator
MGEQTPEEQEQQIETFLDKLGIDAEVSRISRDDMDQFVIRGGIIEIHALGTTTDAYLAEMEEGEFFNQATISNDATGDRTATEPALLVPEWRLDELAEAMKNEELMTEMRTSIEAQMKPQDAELDVFYNKDTDLTNNSSKPEILRPDF